MLAVSSTAWLHAPRPTARSSSATAITGARSTLIDFIIAPSPASVRDKAKIAAIISRRHRPARDAIDPIDAAKQSRLWIGRLGEPVVGACQVLLSDGPDDEGRYQHHQLALSVGIVPAP